MIAQPIAKQDALIEKARRERARRHFRSFVPYVRSGYSMQWFHQVIADKLEAVQRRQIKKLMIFVPPQHGKSELSTRSFPGWVLGQSPNTKVAVVSYSATVAGKFNRDIKRRMQSKPYSLLYPHVALPELRDGYTNNNELFEVVDYEGFVYTVGVGGSLTSVTVDLGIIDDPIKDRQAAQSITIRESTWDWYTDVFETRLHNESVQVVIQTRWHQEDLSGRLLARDGIYSVDNPTGWEVVSLPALRTNDQNTFDQRQVGEALWPERHSQAKIEKIRHDSPVTFNSLYQQDPKPSSEALVYPEWSICDTFPADCEVIFYGQDFGYTNDPSAFIRIGRKANRLYLDEVFYEKGLTNTDIKHRYFMADVSRQAEIYADSAEPKTIDELRRPGVTATGQQLPGFNVKPATKGKDSITAGISKLKEFEVYVTARSRNLIHERNNYEWIMINGQASSEPIDAFNHGMDAVRYAVFTKYYKPTNNRVLI